MNLTTEELEERLEKILEKLDVEAVLDLLYFAREYIPALIKEAERQKRRSDHYESLHTKCLEKIEAETFAPPLDAYVK